MKAPTTAAKRNPPPPLETPLPPCSICNERTDYDNEQFYCQPCGCSWDADLCHLDGHAYWDNPAAAQCKATDQPWKDDPLYPTIRDVTYRCLLDDGHDGDKHRSGDDWDWDVTA